MPKSIQLLPSGYYFRFTIPAGLRQRVGARELRIPLGPHSRAEAELKSSILRPFTSHLLLQLRESGRSMDIREIRAHAVTHCNLQLDGLATSLKLHVHRNRGDSVHADQFKSEKVICQQCVSDIY